jgi:serine/threonine-protein kinase
VLAYAAARRVVRPVRTLANAVRRAVDGDYALAIRDEVSGSAAGAEVDELADAVDALLADLRDKEALIAMTAGAASVPVLPERVAPASQARPLRRRRVGGEGQPVGEPIAHIGAEAGLIIAPGDLLANRYRIESLLGSGGIGLVYRAVDRSLSETVAIKVLRPEVLAGDPAAFDRVKDELRIARRITHRNVVRTHDIGESNGFPFFTMEFVDGTSLADVIHARGALSPSAAVAIAKQLLRALSAAHAQQVVHGDLKPQNLLIGSNGVLKVTDFGVARLVRDPRRRGQGKDAHDVASGRVLGATLGTPEYMAPEQLIGGDASMSSDIYASGIVIHECLTGVTPYRADTPMAFFQHKLATPLTNESAATRTANSPLRVSDMRYSGALERLISRMTAPDPSARASSATELLHAFMQLT